jgi:hypothetical protein
VPGQTAAVAQPPPTTVGITIENLAVFDPAIPQYGRFPYNWLPLHIGTRRSTIRQELLFREGDPFYPEMLMGSERNVRLLPINRAEIT